MTDKKHYTNLNPICNICGKQFICLMDTKNVIVTKCFHSKLRKRDFEGWNYEVIDFNPFTTKLKFKNVWYKIIGFTEIQRKIVLKIWEWNMWLS